MSLSLAKLLARGVVPAAVTVTVRLWMCDSLRIQWSFSVRCWDVGTLGRWGRYSGVGTLGNGGDLAAFTVPQVQQDDSRMTAEWQ